MMREIKFNIYPIGSKVYYIGGNDDTTTAIVDYGEVVNIMIDYSECVKKDGCSEPCVRYLCDGGMGRLHVFEDCISDTIDGLLENIRNTCEHL